MATTRFTPFELLLLKSRNQTDTAALLLLTWVAASKDGLSEADRQRIAAMSASMRHGHDCQAILDIGSRQDLDAIQLAAEVLQKDRWGTQASPFLRQAIEIGVTEGKLAAGTNHILRFLADLLGTSPQQFAQLYRDVAGKPFDSPEDPSREAYWQAREHARQQQRSQSEQRQHEQQSHHRQRHSQNHAGGSRQGGDRSHSAKTLRALDILGLDAGATRNEIKKAYRRLAQTHHPDRFFALGERDVASASMRFQKIQKAYEYLMQDARFI
ncbi:DnaJ domain-containing protein [Halomonas sp. McH1-25]|uniref:J domain-containing protein n=1 Tax=unclassified Halomonas TaxID=2609666 RepID=UPI001EF5138E|nr:MULTISPECIES: DnaJ domain-containing protein [unclassified Halomonas]MCG7600530.1 DnaJ domain-containing protein [Halomonas sp. McH1-25]MCP1341997.1 DnaJ domain-containing protein [Halomonas sp. FL8]MCP1362705.1 DnaJ domain-containing protein [Halomonas sp. BBD45]